MFLLRHSNHKQTNLYEPPYLYVNNDGKQKNIVNVYEVAGNVSFENWVKESENLHRWNGTSTNLSGLK